MDSFDYLIVGAGFAGSTCARQLAEAGKRVLLIDQRDHIGGNSYDYVNEHGILVHKYGAHIFHTNSREVFEFLSRFTEWRPYQHRVRSSVNGELLPVPINRTTLAAFGGDEQAAREAIITPYTRKQWGEHGDRLDPSVLARIKTRDTDDDRYFTDGYQMMPLHGYTKLFERMLDHPNIRVRLHLAYREVFDIFTDEGDYSPPWSIIYTGPIDEYFRYCFGRLPYRSASFEFLTYDFERFQPVGVVNFPSAEVSFTRIAEFKHLTGQRHPKTTIAIETPQAEGEPFWPVPTVESAALYRQYDALAKTQPHVYFLGRLGSYKYYDQHQVIAQALTLSARLLERTSHADAVA